MSRDLDRGDTTPAPAGMIKDSGDAVEALARFGSGLAISARVRRAHDGSTFSADAPIRD